MDNSNVVPINKQECCGCGICVKTCIFNAITMVRDEEGFLYPFVDSEKCKKCHSCVAKCSFYNFKSQEKAAPEVFIGRNKDIDIRLNSRSGAIFVAISDVILKENGVVYGCVLDNENQILHIRAEDKNKRNEMCKSKYAQSNIIGIIDDVITDLKKGRKVLFTGTGCQVQAILDYAKEFKDIDLNNLYTVDFVCHGVVSPLIFEEYINWLGEKYNAKIESFNFRDKSIMGWEEHFESFIVKGKKKFKNIYRNIFYTNLCLRPSCYNCKYTTVNRESDITISDAWGIQKACPELHDNKGASTIIIHNTKGKKLFEEFKKDCDIAEVKIEDILQNNLHTPSKCNGNRDEFWNDYKKYGFSFLVKKYGTQKFTRRVKLKIKYYLYRINKLLKR